MKNMNNQNEEIGETKPPNSLENTWFDYAEKLPFLSDRYLTTFADKLLILTTAILPAYIAGIKLVQIPLSFVLVIPIVLFFITLIFCLISLYPRKTHAEYSSVELIQQMLLTGLERRRIMISIGFLCYILGIISGVIIMLLG